MLTAGLHEPEEVSRIFGQSLSQNMAITCEIINEVAKEIGFLELKDRQQEAALSFLKGNQMCLLVSLLTKFGKSYQLLLVQLHSYLLTLRNLAGYTEPFIKHSMYQILL